MTARRCAIAHLRPWLTYPAWAALLAVLLLSRFFPAASAHWQFAPFLLGMVFLGLPHGALDHLAPLFLRRRRLTPRCLLRFVLGYAALVAAYLLFWRLRPSAALAVFLLFSWLHWGQGDAYFLGTFEGRPPPTSRAERLTVWLVRGGLPIVLPALVFPQVFSQVASGILGWYGGSAGWLLDGRWRVAGLVTLAALIAVYLWRSRRVQRESFWPDAGEVSLLLVFFSLVPPILAVGVYFCVWHSARHLARLMLLDEASAASLSRGELSRPLLRVARQAVPMTLGALLLLAALFWGHGRTHVGAEAFVTLYLSLIAALTFPHFLLVLWMDREELIQHHADPVGIGGRGDALGDGL